MTFKQNPDVYSMTDEMLSDEIMRHQRITTYFSGREKKHSDVVLFGIMEHLDGEGNSYSRIISFHEEELGVLYEEFTNPHKTIKQSRLPNIRKIRNGN